MSGELKGLRFLFALLALVVPVLLGAEIYYQLSTPVIDFTLDWQTGRVLEVPQDSYASFGGMVSGDLLVTVDGVKYSDWKGPSIKTHSIEVEREGRILNLEMVAVSLAQANVFSLFCASAAALIFWGIGLLMLSRRFRQADVRLFFLMAQVFAVAIFLLLAHPRPWPRPSWVTVVCIVCFHIAAPLFLHHILTFPVPLGTPRQRSRFMGIIYFLALVFLIGVLSKETAWVRLGMLYSTLEIGGAIGILAYIYNRRANAESRRALRLIFLGNSLAASPSILFYLLPAVLGSSFRMPTWLVGVFAVMAPISYLYAINRHNLFGVDRLLNRTLVYAILSFGILLLYLGPFLLFYRFRPNDLLAEIFMASGLTLLVGLCFNWTRGRVQRWVDRIFYGGWYDYPGVIETVSEALARCTERELLEQVLNHQVPEKMQLEPGHLLIGDLKSIPQPQDDGTLPQFPFAFQGENRGLWVVGKRRDGENFSETDWHILKTIARQAETALSNVLLIETLRSQLYEIRASRETLAQAQRQLLRSREDERARLARDLHDGPIQVLVGLNLQTGMLLAQPVQNTGLAANKGLEINSLEAQNTSAIKNARRAKSSTIQNGLSPAVAAALYDMRSEVQALLQDLRRVCSDLRPPMLELLGLGAALRSLVDEWSQQVGVDMSLDLPVDAELRTLPVEVALNFYRIVQEALSNIARHAHAQRVTLSLSWEAGCLVLALSDNGRGFVLSKNPNAMTESGHFGLMGMQERADLIGAVMQVESVVGRGTTIQVNWQAK